MSTKNISVITATLLMLLLTMHAGLEPLAAASPRAGMHGARGETKAADMRGTWSGTLYSGHPNVAPFTMTVEINADARGHLIGTSSLSSDCLKGATLQVTIAGSNVVLAGSDEEGDNITVRGVVDASGTSLTSTYTLNGSASGRCESDKGTGVLAKR